MPMPLPGLTGVPFFRGRDATEFLERYDELCNGYGLTEEQKAQFKPVAIELKAGYGTFHHPLLVHGSYENKSNRSRRAFVLNVFADGTTSNSNDEMLQGVPRVNKGMKMEGKFFPLLFDPVKA